MPNEISIGRATNTTEFNTLVSYFPDAYENLPIDISAAQFIAGIKGHAHKKLVETIRKRFKTAIDRGVPYEKAKRAVDSHKKKLASVSLAGVLPMRGKDFMPQFTGLFQGDLDLLGDRLPEIRATLRDDSHIYALFVSATGEGLKPIYRGPICKSADEYKLAFAAVSARVQDLTGVKIDKLEDFTRLCFASYDPDAYLNPFAIELPVDFSKPAEETNPPPPSVSKSDCKIIPFAVEPRRAIAERILGDVEWQNDALGDCHCPGEAHHTTGEKAHECQIHLDGAPTIHCVHKSCESAVAETNHRLRSEIGKIERPTAPPAVAAVIPAFNDPRPKIELPGDNRLLSDFARDLGKAIRRADIFQRCGMVFVVNDRGDGLTPMTADALRSWLEQYAVCYKRRSANGETIQFRRTMTTTDANGVLNSPQFISELREICRFNPVPMPVRRLNGRMELLTPGYDEPSKTFTANNAPTVDNVMPLDLAKGVIDEILAEFKFADDQRSESVEIAAMLTVYALGILPPKSLRPCFVYLANAEGAGKSLLVKLASVPVLGYVPNGVLPKDEDEMRKVLLSAVIEAKPVLCFDNFKGHLQSESLEGFLTSQDWSGRILGGQATFRGDNNVIVFVTGNGCTVSPDMRRRSLFCELFLEVERAEDRQFKKYLEASVILESRTSILSALWAMVREWHKAGEPKPSRSHSSFPEWANTIAAIVEHAGYGCPLETPKIEASADADGDDMRELVKAIVGKAQLNSITFDALVELAVAAGLFERLTSAMNTDNGKASSRATLGRILRSYDRRLVAGCRFSLIGKGHQRRYQAEKVNP